MHAKGQPNEITLSTLDPPEEEITQLRMCIFFFFWLDELKQSPLCQNK